MTGGWYPSFGKRVLDVTAAGAALLLLAPLLGVVGLAIWLEDRGAALFRQPRVGRNGTAFTVLKFRSMPVGTAPLPSNAASGLQVTRVGRAIRRVSIDELPQLWNVLRGDMSLVGPRPALSTQAELLELRHANGSAMCRPGLTGLAQVNSYDGMPSVEKAAYDGEYATCVSLFLDLAIILRTIGYLFRRPPVY